MNETYNDIGKLIRELRYENGISVSTLGEAMQLSTPFIYDIEKGRAKPRFSTLLNLANYFGVSVDYLLGRTDKKSLPADEQEGEKKIEIPAIVTPDGLFFRMKHTPMKMHIVPVVSREQLTATGKDLQKTAMEYLVWPCDKITALVAGMPSSSPYALYVEDTDYLYELGIHRGDKLVVAPREKHEQGALSLVLYYGLPSFWRVYALDGENILLQNDKIDLTLTPEDRQRVGYKFLGLVAGIVGNRPAPRPLIRKQ